MKKWTVKNICLEDKVQAEAPCLNIVALIVIVAFLCY